MVILALALDAEVDGSDVDEVVAAGLEVWEHVALSTEVGDGCFAAVTDGESEDEFDEVSGPGQADEGWNTADGEDEVGGVVDVAGGVGVDDGVAHPEAQLRTGVLEGAFVLGELHQGLVDQGTHWPFRWGGNVEERSDVVVDDR